MRPPDWVTVLPALCQEELGGAPGPLAVGDPSPGFGFGMERLDEGY